MTRVQYGKLLVAQAKKKMADETREMQLEGGAFRKLQIERFRGDASKKVDDVKTTKANVTAVMEAHRARNYEASSAACARARSTRRADPPARAKHQEAVRQIVDVAKKAEPAQGGAGRARVAAGDGAGGAARARGDPQGRGDARGGGEEPQGQIVERVQHETGRRRCSCRRWSRGRSGCSRRRR